MRNCELRMGAGVTLGTVVRENADGRRWGQMNTDRATDYTDLRRFFCRGEAVPRPIPLRPLGEGGHKGVRASAAIANEELRIAEWGRG